MNDTKMFQNAFYSQALNQRGLLDTNMSQDNRLRLVNHGTARKPLVKNLEQNSEYYSSLRTQLMSTLQTTLELEEVLNIFFITMQDLLGVNSLSYCHKDEVVDLEHGEAARHNCSYSLSNNHQYLGEIVFSRKQRFQEQELNILEYLMGTLIYPLRNALMFHSALRCAHTDPLTGLGSRSALATSLEREFNIARRQVWPLSLLVVDIDFFKRVNDTHGHSVGDYVLKSVAEAIKSCLRNTDQSFRYGGEEFVVVLGKTCKEQAIEVAERIRETIADLRIDHNGIEIKTSVSIGVAQAEEGDESLSLFNRTDKALYEAKNNGRNAVFSA
jgi:diguanylate cyclase (GGDEF)-like protein